MIIWHISPVSMSEGPHTRMHSALCDACINFCASTLGGGYCTYLDMAVLVPRQNLCHKCMSHDKYVLFKLSRTSL